MLLMLKSLIPFAVFINNYWQKLFPRPLLQLVTLKSQLATLEQCRDPDGLSGSEVLLEHPVLFRMAEYTQRCLSVSWEI